MSFVIVHRPKTTLEVMITIPTEEDCIDGIIQELETEGHVCRKVDPKRLPTDTTYEKAWFFNDDMIIPIDISPNVAKEILRDQWRQVRAPLLETLDRAYMMAMERNDPSTMADVAKRKQKLRSITSDHMVPDRLPSENIDAYSKRLSACWPKGLQPI